MATVNSQSCSIFKIYLWYICSQNSGPSLYPLSAKHLYRSLQIFTAAHRIKPRTLIGLLRLYHQLRAFPAWITTTLLSFP